MKRAMGAIAFLNNSRYSKIFFLHSPLYLEQSFCDIIGVVFCIYRKSDLI